MTEPEAQLSLYGLRQLFRYVFNKTNDQVQFSQSQVVDGFDDEGNQAFSLDFILIIGMLFIHLLALFALADDTGEPLQPDQGPD